MSHLNTLLLHQLRYGELTGEGLARARAHLDTCPTCAGRLRAQQAERQVFVARPVPPLIRRATTPPSTRWWTWLAPALLAALAVVVVRVAQAPQPAAIGEPAPEVRFRGSLPTIEVWVRGERGARALAPGERVGPGSTVQLVYDPQGASAVALAGRDGSGTVQVYTTRAPTGIGLVQAPFALTLDDTPGDQELFVVGSDLPLDDGVVRLAVTQGVPGARVARVRLQR